MFAVRRGRAPGWRVVLSMASGLIGLHCAAAPQLAWSQRVSPLDPLPQWTPQLVHDPLQRRVDMFGGSCCGTNTGVWEWDGTRWHLLEPEPAPQPRFGHTFVFDAARGVGVCFGGRPESSLATFLNDTWIWSGATRSWTQPSPAPSPTPRASHAMAYDPVRQRVVLFGGEGTTGVLNDTWQWDGTMWTQVAVSGSLPPARKGHILAWDPSRQQVLLFGGDGPGYLNDTWLFNGTTWTQQPVGAPGPRRYHGSSTHVPLGGVLIFGGEGPPGVSYLQDTWLWNGSTWSQQPGPSPAPRAVLGMTYDATNGYTLLFGGSNSGIAYADTWKFDTQWTKLRNPAGPFNFTPFGLAYFASQQRVIVYGGGKCVPMRPPTAPPPSFNDETWEWDGTRWASCNCLGPPGRLLHGIAYDTASDALVLFGGTSSVLRNLDDTWKLTWLGVWQWQQLSPPVRPPGRFAHGIAYDEERRQTVIFGGRLVSGYGNDTWVFDCATSRWTQRFPPQQPSVREYANMTYDRRRQRVVLFGGVNQSGTLLTDTWEWDGTQWLQRNSQQSPPGRGDSELVYDAEHCKSVLWGGFDSTQSPILDPWEWDGVDWRRSTTTGPLPPPRYGHGMAYDAARRAIVLFGGVNGTGGHHQDTWELRTTQPANFTLYGQACGNPPPVLGHRGLPYTGCTMDVTLAQAPRLTAAVLFLGAQQIPLGLALASIGAPGCYLYLIPDVFLPPTGTDQSGNASMRLDIPRSYALVGALAYVQFVVGAVGANPLGLVFTQGGCLTVGH